MKTLRKLTLAAVLALAGANLASATTTVYHVAGAASFRIAIVSAEVAIAGGTNAFATYYGTSLTGSNYSVVQNAATNPTIKFENDFSGGVAGAASISTKSTIPFPLATAGGELPTAVTTAPSAPTTAAAGGHGVAQPSSTTTLAPYTDIENVSADVIFADNTFDVADQIISASSNPTIVYNPSSNTAIVGVLPYVFVANGSSDVYGELSGLGINPQNFTFIWSSGGLTPLSFLTGGNSTLDTNSVVYPIGRDTDAGARATALAETGYGLTGSGIITAPVAQYYPYNSSTNAGNNTLTGVIGVDTTLTSPSIAAINLVPAEVSDGYSEPVGDGGYPSSSSEVIGLSTSFASGVTNTVFVGYLAAADAKSALTASGTNRTPAVLLSYNGVTFVPNPSTISPTTANSLLIEEGKYTFWGYERIYTTVAAAGLIAQFQTQLTTNNFDQFSTAGVSYAALQANGIGRSDDGQNVQ